MGIPGCLSVFQKKCFFSKSIIIRQGFPGLLFYRPVFFQLNVIRQIYSTGSPVSQLSAQPILAKQNALDKPSHLLPATQPLATILIYTLPLQTIL